ncbi:MAG: tRNA lysidine(34) synthetase TilS [Candidatus Omnitrophica bacterium]|jgi:tRNA(Ile)-lysidine synthase|nr:tRNA lysidine(34) synthetase TilS [Candidatus Omnitrophota bacterium]
MVIEQLKKTSQRYRLINKNDKILVGVSAGPDSSALLRALVEIAPFWGLKLHLAHLDHALRPDSYKDRKLAEKLAKKYGLKITTARIAAKNIPRNNIEETARNARLKFLFETARKNHINKIALGHNLDDQAETVLMRIIRGTGLYGLRGILPKRQLHGFTIIRPLVETSRKDIRIFLKNNRIPFRIDKTNAEDKYLRNRLRKQLIPLLEQKYNRNIKSALRTLAVNAETDHDYLYEKAKKIVSNRKTVEIANFVRLHPAMQNLVIRLLIENLKGDTRRIAACHIHEIVDTVYNRPNNSIVDLPAGIAAVKKSGYLKLQLAR